VAIDVNTGQANRISDNRIDDAGTGVLLCCGVDSDRNVVAGNRISDTLGSGVAVFISGAARVVGNLIMDTGRHAISLLGPSSRGALIAGNVLARSQGAGIVVEGCPECARSPEPALDRVRVQGNRIRSVADGILLLETDDDVVRGNSVSGAAGVPDSLGTGVLLDGVSRTVVQANAIVRSGGPLDGNAGIMVGVAPELEPSARPVDGNLVAANSVIAQHGDGISVAALASDTTLRGNATHRNERDGIRVLSASTTLLRNTALRNGAFGIEAVAGVTDGGGNVARGNANRPQCTGVACG
jgi:nitrous oxidase accessory protein NosD